MKNVLNTLLVSSIVLGGSTLGLVANAAENKTEDKKDSNGYVTFEKGDLSFAPQLAGEAGATVDTTEVVPTFEFNAGKVGEATKGLTLVKEGNKGKGYTSTGVSDYTGETKGWHVTITAAEFTSAPKGRAIVDPLKGLTINFDATSQDVTGQQDKGNKTKEGTPSAKNTVTADGKTSALLFNAAAADSTAGKFLFDYSKTTLDIPQAAAAGAKSGVDYTSALTWNLQQETKAALQAAVPAV